MTRSQVALVKQAEGEPAPHVVWRALDLIGAATFLAQFQSFLLKPNYIVDAPPSGGLTTRPESLDGLITYLFQKVGKSPRQVTLGRYSTRAVIQKIRSNLGISHLVPHGPMAPHITE